MPFTTSREEQTKCTVPVVDTINSTFPIDLMHILNLVIVDGDVPRGDELEVGVEMTGRERTQKQLFVKLVRRRRENEGTP